MTAKSAGFRGLVQGCSFKWRCFVPALGGFVCVCVCVCVCVSVCSALCCVSLSLVSSVCVFVVLWLCSCRMGQETGTKGHATTHGFDIIDTRMYRGRESSFLYIIHRPVRLNSLVVCVVSVTLAAAAWSSGTCSTTRAEKTRQNNTAEYQYLVL